MLLSATINRENFLTRVFMYRWWVIGCVEVLQNLTEFYSKCCVCCALVTKVIVH